jgi:hypothetical protein
VLAEVSEISRSVPRREKVTAARSSAADEQKTDGRCSGDVVVVVPSSSSSSSSSSRQCTMRGTLAELLDGDGADALGSDAVHAYEAAEAARAQAASDAAEGARRLEVARRQFAEYATARASEATAMAAKIAATRAVAVGRPVVDDEIVERVSELGEAAEAARAEAAAMAATAMEGVVVPAIDDAEGAGAKGGGVETTTTTTTTAAAAAADLGAEKDDEAEEPMETDAAVAGALGARAGAANATIDAGETDFTERAKFIPLRLDNDERKMLRLLEAALHVSEYTDKVDVMTFRSKTQRITKQLREICAIMCGLGAFSSHWFPYDRVAVVNADP